MTIIYRVVHEWPPELPGAQHTIMPKKFDSLKEAQEFADVATVAGPRGHRFFAAAQPLEK
jgi:hypothetical protein